MHPEDHLTSEIVLSDYGLSRDDALNLYRYLRLSREMDNRSVTLYRQGRLLGALYTGIGNEAVAVGSAYALRDGDVICPMHREGAVGARCIACGGICQLYGQGWNPQLR